MSDLTIIGKRTWAVFRDHPDGTVESTQVPTWAAEAIVQLAAPTEQVRTLLAAWDTDDTADTTALAVGPCVERLREWLERQGESS